MAPGKTIYVVTGVNRSGLSVMTDALEAGGMEPSPGLPRPGRGGRGRPAPLTPQDVDKVAGKIVKATPRQVSAIPDGNIVVVYMRRDPAEVAAALETATNGRFEVNAQRRGRAPVDAVGDRVERTRGMLRDRPGVKVMDVSYEDLVADPSGTLGEVAAFFGVGLDVDKAAATVSRPDGGN